MWSTREVTKEIVIVSLIALCGLAIFCYKISRGQLDYSGDYQTYIATSQLFAQPFLASSSQPAARLQVPAIPATVQVFPARVLKPLEPALTALVAIALPGLGFQAAFLFWVGMMYALLVFAVFIFFKKCGAVFSTGPSYQALAATAFFALSYPMLRYGLDAYTETGALLFYVLGLLGCLYFLKNPSWKILFCNVIIDVVGFFWKEYSILPLIILNIIIIFQPLLASTSKKIKYLVVLDALFLLPNIIWESYVKAWLHYDYFSWYVQGGAANFDFSHQLFLIIKSLFALLVVGWVFVPWSIKAIGRLEKPRKFFFWLILCVPLIVLVWGAVSSRLFYVLMPGLCLACVWGIKEVFPSRKGQIISCALVLISGIAWFAVSLKII